MHVLIVSQNEALESRPPALSEFVSNLASVPFRRAHGVFARCHDSETVLFLLAHSRLP